jgi:hypothetical protein
MTVDIGSRTLLRSNFGDAKCMVIGLDPVYKAWIIEITTPRHEIYKRGQRIYVDIRSTLLKLRYDHACACGGGRYEICRHCGSRCHCGQ